MGLYTAATWWVLKKAALLGAKGDYDSPATLTVCARRELLWWISNITSAKNDIVPSDPQIMAALDASALDGGASAKGSIEVACSY